MTCASLEHKAIQGISTLSCIGAYSVVIKQLSLVQLRESCKVDRRYAANQVASALHAAQCSNDNLLGCTSSAMIRPYDASQAAPEQTAYLEDHLGHSL
eukprot:19737-Heterococcus_DN1.PRE.1